ncbi:hypothetical protein [Snuella sedimenti]|nr:hypothetical protein [Snuella sedimenti]
MKKNLLSALVIFFVTFACLLAISEVSSSSSEDELLQDYSEIK